MENAEDVSVTPQKLHSTWNDPQILGILVAIIAIVFTLVFYSLYKKRLRKKNSILLLGLCGAGKTLVFARLLFKRYVQTHTSVKENSGEYPCGPTVFKVIDIPGHERLRNRFFDEFKSSTRGLVFVIDSLVIQKEIKDVAEFLYHCLTDSYIANNMPPVLILCNKQGEALAKESSLIKKLLELELNILCKIQTNQLDSLIKGANNVFLGKEGKDFEFSDLSPMRVTFGECFATTAMDGNNFNLNALEKWIQSLV